MAKKMLIDATHLEETRVVVVDGNKVDDFDFESVAKRQLAGNIYLAKVTRVEPSLQAAFVDYGGNRHGFLAFAEIHPDYYQIPVADREALIAEEAAEQERSEAGEVRRDDAAEQKAKDEKGKDKARRGRRKKGAKAAKEESAEESAGESAAEGSEPEAAQASEPAQASGPDEASEPDAGQQEAPAEKPKTRRTRRGRKADKHKSSGLEVIDFEAGESAAGDAPGGSGVRGLEIADPSEEGTSKDDASGDDASENDAFESDGDDKGAPPRSMAEKTGLDEAETVSEEPETVSEEPEADSGKGSGKGARKGAGRGSRKGAGKGAGRKPRKAERQPAAEASEPESGEAQAGEAPGEAVESIEPDEPQEEAARARAQLRRRYRIQDVIKVRQIMLVQVVKEERGTKGAALTTYLSLPGRYCVLMPNTARGGGISRKISNAPDRKRLRAVVDELDVPPGMGLIVRTAGAERTRAEIKRDFEFLLRQWEQIRELTLNSIAPTLIYEEGSLIKRSIRDLYSKEIEAIQVEGEAGYREAKDYMKMLMPSHARHVQQYTDRIPLFSRYQVESYLNGMFNPVVQMRSGGYIVIGQTEALVAIDVNSGRSTRESSIEETALKTNLEAAEEIARQLRLRDLAGLIVIDFIDMDDARNNRAVEKRLKDKLKVDRARLQLGRISAFGLLEMSRQRLRPGMVEISTQPCPHCHGQGTIRSDESLALTILREVEEEGVRGRAAEVTVAAPVSIANYIINAKRRHLAQIDERYGMAVSVVADTLLRSPEYRIEPSRTRSRQPDELREAVVTPQSAVAASSVEAPQAEATAPAEDGDKDKAESRSRRRRGKRGGRRRRGEQEAQGGDQGGDQGTDQGESRDSGAAEPQEAQTRGPDRPASDTAGEAAAEDTASPGEATADTTVEPEGDGGQRPRKRRGSRAGSRRKDESPETPETETPEPAAAMADTPPEAAAPEPDAAASGANDRAAGTDGPSSGSESPPEAGDGSPDRAPDRADLRQSRRADDGEDHGADHGEDDGETVSETVPAEPEANTGKKQRSGRRGWWQLR